MNSWSWLCGGSTLIGLSLWFCFVVGNCRNLWSWSCWITCLTCLEDTEVVSCCSSILVQSRGSTASWSCFSTAFPTSTVYQSDQSGLSFVHLAKTTLAFGMESGALSGCFAEAEMTVFLCLQIVGIKTLIVQELSPSHCRSVWKLCPAGTIHFGYLT